MARCCSGDKDRRRAVSGGAVGRTVDRAAVGASSSDVEGLRSRTSDGEEAKAPDARASETGRMIAVNRRMGQDSIRMAADGSRPGRTGRGVTLFRGVALGKSVSQDRRSSEHLENEPGSNPLRNPKAIQGIRPVAPDGPENLDGIGCPHGRGP